MGDKVFSREEKLRCLELELRRRRRVFADLVESGRMRKDKAERETALLQAIVDDYSRP
jgi:hypothetical protein